MAGRQVLQIVDHGDALGLGGPQEVILDRVRVVSKRNLDRALEAMDVTIPTSALARACRVVDVDMTRETNWLALW